MSRGAREAGHRDGLAVVGGVIRRHEEKVRFLAIGGWNTLFGVGVLYVLDMLIDYDMGSLLEKQGVLALSWAISITQNYVAFKSLVFRTRGNWLLEYVRMYGVYALMFAVQSALVLTISGAFGLTVFWANLPTLAIITVLSYLGHKYFTFRGAADVFVSDGAGTQ